MEIKYIQEKLKRIENDIQVLIKDIEEVLERETKETKEKSKEPEREENTVCRVMS